MYANELRNLLSLEIRDISDVSIELFLSWVNRVEQDIWKIAVDAAPEEYLKEYSLSIIDGIDKYDLPNDFGRMDIYGSGIFALDDNGKPCEAISKVPYSSKKEGFYLTQEKIVFVPSIKSNDEYVMRYIPKKSDLDEIGDELNLKDVWKSAVLEGLKKMYYAWEEDEVGETLADKRYARSIQETAIDSKRVNEISFLEDTSLYFS